jgi:trigger factor
MQVSIDEVNATRRKLAVEVPVEEVAAEFDRAFGRVQKQAKLKGFRPGRAPRSVVEKLFGDQVRADVLSNLIEHSYSDAVKQAGLRPVGPPEIVPESIEAGKPLRYSATIDVLPKIEIGNTIGLSAKRLRREITDADVDRAVEQLRESLAELRPVEGREDAREGDFVSVDYAGFVDGRPLPDGKRENRLFELGKGGAPAEFERALVGANVGESRTVEISYPAEHADAAVAGKSARFDIRLRAIREKILPAMDDDLAKEHGECATLAELRAKLRERIAESMRREGDEHVREQVLDQLLQQNPFDVPRSLVDRQVNAFVEDLLERIGAQREALERDTERLDKLREEYRPRAERQVRAVVALDAVAEHDQVEVSEQDVDQRVAELVRRAGEHAARLREIYRDPSSREELRARMARERALDAIVAAARVEDVDPPINVVAPVGEKG